MLTYNNQMFHSSIKMTPYEAAKPSNAIDVKHTMELQASLSSKYPGLQIGSNVKLYNNKNIRRNGKT